MEALVAFELLERLTMLSHEQWLSICGSRRWVKEIMSLNLSDLNEALQAAERIWNALPVSDCLEAFAAHPQIGDRQAMKSASEQAKVRESSQATLDGLAKLNEDYFKKFGFIYIVCASGKSGAEMLEDLKCRLVNRREEEIKIARREQLKIIRLRLEKIW